jgi:hypothetical protein
MTKLAMLTGVTVLVGAVCTPALGNGCDKVIAHFVDEGEQIGVAKLKAEDCEYLEVEIELENAAPDTTFMVYFNDEDTEYTVETDYEGEGETKFHYYPDGGLVGEDYTVTIDLVADEMTSYSVTVLVPLCGCTPAVVQGGGGCEKVLVPFLDDMEDEVGFAKLKAEECEYLEVELELKDAAPDMVFFVWIDGEATMYMIVTDDEGEGEVEFEWEIYPAEGEETYPITIELVDADGEVYYTATADVPLCDCEEEEEDGGGGKK